MENEGTLQEPQSKPQPLGWPPLDWPAHTAPDFKQPILKIFKTKAVTA